MLRTTQELLGLLTHSERRLDFVKGLQLIAEFGKPRSDHSDLPCSVRASEGITRQSRKFPLVKTPKPPIRMKASVTGFR